MVKPRILKTASLKNIKPTSEGRSVTLTSKPIILYTNFTYLTPHLTSSELLVVFMGHLQGLRHASKP